MRRERITPRKATAIWEAVRSNYRGLLSLPPLDFSKLYGNKKSLPAADVVGWISCQITAANL